MHYRVIIIGTIDHSSRSQETCVLPVWLKPSSPPAYGCLISIEAGKNAEYLLLNSLAHWQQCAKQIKASSIT